jgi:N,N'-diacetyllegionaminate synthase
MKFIAEIGWNFLGDMQLAKEMVSQASLAGATIAKFQLWDPKSLKEGAWDNDGRRGLYEKSTLDKNKIKILMEECNKKNIDFLMSVFEQDSLTLLSDITTDCVKIPSHECINFNLIDSALDQFEEVIVSIGAIKESDLEEFVKRYQDRKKLKVMHCVSSYPLPAEAVNLDKINYLLNNFQSVGYSSHYQGVVDATAATAIGVTFIEKHFTTDNNLPGRDNKFALLPAQFRLMVDSCLEVKKMLIDQGLGLQECEKDVANNMRGRWSK